MIKEEHVIATSSSSNQSGSNDFVKKLYQMLQIDSYKDIVRWTASGDSFVVLNTNEFTKELLPRHFKHSNFASFVRQLNKYDFHKVKLSNDEKSTYPYPEDSWEFKHPDFKVNNVDALDNIRRKAPGGKKASSQGESLPHVCQSAQLLVIQNQMKDQINQLNTENFNLQKEISLLNTKYKTLIGNIVAINSINERNYHAIGNLLSVLVQSGIKLPPLDFPNPSLVSIQNHTQQQNIYPNASSNPMAPAISPGQQLQPGLQPGIQGQPPQPPSRISSSSIPTLPPQQIPASELPMQQNPIPLLSRNSSSALVEDQSQQSPEPSSKPKFHVLLVEDDNVCIQLCRKFLVKYGCEVTVVTDGLNAISTVENVKYDLVLMDIVMPNLDGATATSVIRSFDTKTPIIAMTGNIDDNDLVTYLQNGMSDILAKPFTKDDLYSILAKHLLKKDQQSTQAPSVAQNQPGTLPQQIPAGEIPNGNNVGNQVGFIMEEESARKKQRID